MNRVWSQFNLVPRPVHVWWPLFIVSSLSQSRIDDHYSFFICFLTIMRWDVVIAWARAELCHVPLTMAIFARDQSTMTTAMDRNKESCLWDDRSFVLLYTRSYRNRCLLYGALFCIHFKSKSTNCLSRLSRSNSLPAYSNERKRPYNTQLSRDWGTPTILWVDVSSLYRVSSRCKPVMDVFLKAFSWASERVERRPRVSVLLSSYFSYGARCCNLTV